ncbi:hypothetical protein GmRootV213_57110 (plasmid) [Variovorax sp. V213]|uniref:ABC transporter substrate-binding protein n=1 Tax=Variovorax sp. V213 TaxID=3065955 RepID=UPI0034E88219
MSITRFQQQRRTLLAAAGTLMLAYGLPVHAQGGGGAEPIRVGGTLPLTGPLAPVGGIHKVAAEVFVDALNKRGGLLGRKVELMLLDDQSQPGNARTLYERLITREKVDLLMGPYGTSSIIAAMGVAQRFNKLFIQSSLGDPSLAPYEMQFPALPLGPEPRLADTEVLLDAYASTTTPPRPSPSSPASFPRRSTWPRAGRRSRPGEA